MMGRGTAHAPHPVSNMVEAVIMAWTYTAVNVNDSAILCSLSAKFCKTEQCFRVQMDNDPKHAAKET